MAHSNSYTIVNPRPTWDMHNPHSRLGQIWVTNIRKVYHPLGFHKGYNFPLFLIGVGALMGFVLSRMFYYDFDNTFSKVGWIVPKSRNLLTRFQNSKRSQASSTTTEVVTTKSASYYIWQACCPVVSSHVCSSSQSYATKPCSFTDSTVTPQLFSSLPAMLAHL